MRLKVTAFRCHGRHSASSCCGVPPANGVNMTPARATMMTKVWRACGDFVQFWCKRKERLSRAIKR